MHRCTTALLFPLRPVQKHWETAELRQLGEVYIYITCLHQQGSLSPSCQTAELVCKAGVNSWVQTVDNVFFTLLSVTCVSPRLIRPDFIKALTAQTQGIFLSLCHETLFLISLQSTAKLSHNSLPNNQDKSNHSTVESRAEELTLQRR